MRQKNKRTIKRLEASSDYADTHKVSEQKQQCAVSDITETPAEQPCLASEEAWLSYWQQHGEGLLWQSWLEKQPNISCSSTQDCSRSEAGWDEHYQQTYQYYWEQFHYWAVQGWTVDETYSTTAASEEYQGSPGETEALENQTEERSKADVTHLISSLSLLTEEVDGENGDQQSLVCNCADEPCDGGNRKRSIITYSLHWQFWLVHVFWHSRSLCVLAMGTVVFLQWCRTQICQHLPALWPTFSILNLVQL